MTRGTKTPVLESVGATASTPASPRLLGLGEAPGSRAMSQAEGAARIAGLLDLHGEQRDRWQRIVEGSGIESRGLAIDPDQLGDVIGSSTQARMRLYERLAPDLGTDAAGAALSHGGVEPNQISDLIVVSCTGFSAPGLDIALVKRLGLRADVRRTVVGFMGCFGGLIGLRQAVMICRAQPSAQVLVVCVELCSLHLRRETEGENMVASALFSDGASAALVCGGSASADRPGGSHRGLGRLTTGSSRVLPEGHDWMSWRITDAGFAMTLSREVPKALRSAIRSFVLECDPVEPRTYAIHPGGPGILDAVDAGLGLSGANGLECSADILRRYGNMSSCTILFVLAEIIRRGRQRPVMMLAFGPGLSIEGMCLID